MAIAFVSGSWAETGGGGITVTSLVVPAPAGIVAGNLLLAVVYTIGSSSTVTITAPSGWALAPGPNPNHSGSSAGDEYVFTKTATGSEPSTYTFHVSGGEFAFTVGIAQFSGTTTLDGSCAFTDHSTATSGVTCVGQTPSAGNTADYWVTAYGSRAGCTFSTPAGASVAVGQSDVGNQSMYIFYVPLSSASPTGTQTVTQGCTTQCGCVSLLLGPAVTSVSGTASVALGPLVVAATGHVGIPGTAALALGPLVVAATNTFSPVAAVYVGWIPHTHATGQPP